MDNFCKIEYHTLIGMLFDIWCLNDGSIYCYINEFDLEELIKVVPNNEIYGEFRTWLIAELFKQNIIY